MQKLNAYLDKIYNFDYVDTIYSKYKSINSVYRKSFWTVFILLNIAFGLHTANFMWGHHDWGKFSEHIGIRNSFAYGRYMCHVLRHVFLSAVTCLPILHNLISFTALSLTGILFCRYISLEKRTALFIFVSLVLVMQPETLSIFWYAKDCPETFFGPVFLMAGFICAENSSKNEYSKRRQKFWLIESIISFFLGLSCYPVNISAIGVVLCGKLCLTSWDWDGTKQNFKEKFYPLINTIISIIIGITIYRIFTIWIWPIEQGEYNTDTISLSDLPKVLVIVFKNTFKHIFSYKTSFISPKVINCFSAFTVIFFLRLITTGTFLQRILRVIFFIGAVLATQTAIAISVSYKEIFTRLDIYGLVYLQAFCVVGALYILPKLKNVAYLILTYVCLVSATQCLDVQRVWKQSFDAERMLWNRMLIRLEDNPNFDANKKFTLIQIGAPLSLRPKFYLPLQKNENIDSDLVGTSREPSWYVGRALQFYYPTNFIAKKKFPHDAESPLFKKHIERLKKAGILNKANAWPKNNSIQIYEDLILVVTDENRLKEYLK